MAVSPAIVLSVEDLSIRYRLPSQQLLKPPASMTAVDRVSFKVRAGATLGLVGESGSGKSSTARAVMALERPSSGRVRLFDRDLATLSRGELKQLRQSFQMIFQDPYGSLDPRYSIERIIVEPIHGIARSEARQRAAHALEEVGLRADDLRKYPNQFSGGQRQRIAIARALVTRPALIVADEAVSALDVSVQAQVLNLMKDLQAEHNMAYLFISHDLAVVRYLCEEIIVLFRGAIVESGNTLEVLQSPAHPYTRELIDAMPRLGVRRRVARIVPGSPGGTPSAEVGLLQGGCPYRTRCARAAAVCQEAPELRERGDGRQVACHFG
ncbi:oligopeptide/dipeptide ABC transporter ATP-binding protein [Paralcaligenes ureilyticus]|uniref:oligopeptide/dipeptide ABC transporter ATP-binding protein n=1 Tax=Paralcaligenes ureilyticus TaxID=627131 RepID=UPI001404EDFD